MTHELDVVRARTLRHPSAGILPRRDAASRRTGRAGAMMALIPRLGRSPSQAAMRILETTWRLWREPSIKGGDLT